MASSVRRTRRAHYVESGSGAGSRVLNGFLTLAFLAGGGYVAYWAYTTHKAKLAAAAPEAKPDGSAPKNPEPPPARRDAPPPPPPPPKAVIAKACNDLNLAVMSKELSRYKGESGGERRAELTAANHRSRLERVSAGESYVPEHLEPEDQILAIGSTFAHYADLTQLPGPDAAARITKALQKIPAGTQFRYRIRRDGRERDLYVYFHEGATVGDVRLDLPEKVKISYELSQEVSKKFFSLPVYYQETYISRDEMETLKRILREGEASPDEYAFLTRKVLRTAAADASSEQEWFRKRKAELEKIIEGVRPPDIILTHDGRRYEGQIVTSTGQPDLNRPVPITTPVGRFTIFPQDIKDVRMGKDLNVEFKNRLAAAGTQVGVYQQTLVWCRELGLNAHREYTAYVMLLRDPTDRVARVNAGYHQGGGKWVLEPASLVTAQTAEIKAGDSKAELMPRLERMGFMQRGGRWYNKVAWKAGFDSLYNTGSFRWQGQDVEMKLIREGDTPLALLNTQAQNREGATPPKMRVILPLRNSGSASIAVEAPAEIAECQIKATLVILGGINKEKMGKVELYVTPEAGKPVLLHSSQDLPAMDFFEISPIVKGKRRFTVTAYMTTTIDRFGTYARFLPSLPDTKDTFAVKGSVLQPAPDIDAIWARAR